VRVVAAFQNTSCPRPEEEPGQSLSAAVLVCADDLEAAEQVISLSEAGGMRAYYGGTLTMPSSSKADLAPHQHEQALRREDRQHHNHRDWQMKCVKCGKKAVINMRQHKLALCKEHFLEWIPAQVQRAIEKYDMFGKEARISGGGLRR